MEIQFKVDLDDILSDLIYMDPSEGYKFKEQIRNDILEQVKTQLIKSIISQQFISSLKTSIRETIKQDVNSISTELLKSLDISIVEEVTTQLSKNFLDQFSDKLTSRVVYNLKSSKDFIPEIINALTKKEN